MNNVTMAAFSDELEKIAVSTKWVTRATALASEKASPARLSKHIGKMEAIKHKGPSWSAGSDAGLRRLGLRRESALVADEALDLKAQGKPVKWEEPVKPSPRQHKPGPGVETVERSGGSPESVEGYRPWKGGAVLGQTKKAGELAALAGMMANSPVLRAQRATQAYKKNKQEVR